MRLRGETRKIRSFISQENLTPTPPLKNRSWKKKTFLQSSVFWTSELKHRDFISENVNGWAYGPAFRFSLLSWRSWQFTTEIYNFLDTGCLTKQMTFFYLQWNLSSRERLGTKASVPWIKVSLEWSLGWHLLVILKSTDETFYSTSESATVIVSGS